MAPFTIAHFGEAEKGEFHIPTLCHDLIQLEKNLGHPPPYTQGIFYAVQSLLYSNYVLFVRVGEEGSSTKDYIEGMHLLAQYAKANPIAAICMPGVGDESLYSAFTPLCSALHSVLITNDADYYDYMTSLGA
jgi:hypothetical protein